LEPAAVIAALPDWIDKEREKTVLVDGQNCCLKGCSKCLRVRRPTQEHEGRSFVGRYERLTRAEGLIALGAKWATCAVQPEFKKQEGKEIDVSCGWKVSTGKDQDGRAQGLGERRQDEKEMTYPCVAGSGFGRTPIMERSL